MEIKLDAFYSTEWGDFEIRASKYLFNSYDRDGNALVCGATPEAVYWMTPEHLMAHKLGLKEETTYEGTVGGKL